MAGPGSAGCLPEREDGADSRRLRRTRGQRHGERDEVGALGGGNFRSSRRRARGRFAVHPFGRQELARAAFGGGTFGEEPPAGSSGIPSGYRGFGGIPGRILGGPDTGGKKKTPPRPPPPAGGGGAGGAGGGGARPPHIAAQNSGRAAGRTR